MTDDTGREVLSCLRESEEETSPSRQVENFAMRLAGCLLVAKLVLSAVHLVQPQPHGKFGILVLAGIMILAILLAHLRFLSAVVKQGLMHSRYEHTAVMSNAKRVESLVERLAQLDRTARSSLLESIKRQRSYLSDKMSFLVGSLEKTGIVPAFLMLFVTASRFGGTGDRRSATLDAFDYGLIAILALYYLGFIATSAIARLDAYSTALASSLERDQAG